jgi:hypothetical protein
MPPSDTVTQFADWVIGTHDNHRRPFVIVDKTAAEVFVFDARGRLSGAAPALIGSAPGDDSAPGVGDRELSSIPMADRTTPAGRFIAGFGPDDHGQPVLWIDYATAVSLHRVLTTDRSERRLQRLQTATPDDNRITHGCINVPVAFFDTVVRPAFWGRKGVVYVLPDTRPLEDVFPRFRLHERTETQLEAAAEPAAEAAAEPAAIWSIPEDRAAALKHTSPTLKDPPAVQADGRQDPPPALKAKSRRAAARPSRKAASRRLHHAFPAQGPTPGAGR